MRRTQSKAEIQSRNRDAQSHSQSKDRIQILIPNRIRNRLQK